MVKINEGFKHLDFILTQIKYISAFFIERDVNNKNTSGNKLKFELLFLKTIINDYIKE